ncbi:MAG: hypothetical protein E7333_08970 [Clostridiales bacterium]|nr:hypothetical protein [Clostridiales bacterium]
MPLQLTNGLKNLFSQRRETTLVIILMTPLQQGVFLMAPNKNCWEKPHFSGNNDWLLADLQERSWFFGKPKNLKFF